MMTATEFEHIVLPLCPELLALAKSVLGDADDAADVLQDTLVAAWRNKGSVGDWRSYLRRSVRNRSLNTLRDRHDERYAAMPADREPVATETPETLLERRDTATELAAMIATLQPKAARIMVLSVYEQMSVEEIAEATGESQANVRQILSRSRRALTMNVANHKP